MFHGKFRDPWLPGGSFQHLVKLSKEGLRHLIDIQAGLPGVL